MIKGQHTDAAMLRRGFFFCLTGDYSSSYGSVVSYPGGLPISALFMSGVQPTAQQIVDNAVNYTASSANCLAVVDYYVKGDRNGPFTYTYDNCLRLMQQSGNVLYIPSLTGITAQQSGTCSYIIACHTAALYNLNSFTNLDFVVLPVGAGPCNLVMPSTTLAAGVPFDSGTISFFL